MALIRNPSSFTSVLQVCTARGLAYICILLVLQANFSHASECGKLEFKSIENGCRNCSMCSSNVSESLIRMECQHNNPQQLHNGEYLWCQAYNGPFPFCKPLPSALVIHSCSHDQKKPPPNSSCNIGCGERNMTVRCSENITWVPDPELCPPPPRTTDTITTVVSDPSSSETTPMAAGTDQDSITPVVIAIAVAVGLVILGFAAVGARAVWRKCMRDNRSINSSSAESIAYSPVVNGEPAMSNKCMEVGGERTNSKCAAVDHHQVSASRPPQPSRETLHHVGRCNLTKGADAPAVPFLPPKRPETAFPELPEGQHTGQDSYRALDALLNDKKNATCFCEFFDVADGFDRVTWHNLAEGLLKKGKSEIRAMEYFRPQGSASLADRPTYQVLQQLKQEGSGLVELRDFLSKQKHTNLEALTFLDSFMCDWRRINKVSV